VRSASRKRRISLWLAISRKRHTLLVRRPRAVRRSITLVVAVVDSVEDAAEEVVEAVEVTVETDAKRRRMTMSIIAQAMKINVSLSSLSAHPTRKRTWP
jgi:hypothetical protein